MKHSIADPALLPCQSKLNQRPADSHYRQIDRQSLDECLKEDISSGILAFYIGNSDVQHVEVKQYTDEGAEAGPVDDERGD